MSVGFCQLDRSSEHIREEPSCQRIPRSKFCRHQCRIPSIQICSPSWKADVDSGPMVGQRDDQWNAGTLLAAGRIAERAAESEGPGAHGPTRAEIPGSIQPRVDLDSCARGEPASTGVRRGPGEGHPYLPPVLPVLRPPRIGSALAMCSGLVFQGKAMEGPNKMR